MKNTYDILVNFKDQAYEFYEWNKNDDIKHVKSIPTFRVSNDCLLDFDNCNLVVSKKKKKMIENQTEIFYKGTIKVEAFSCVLFCDYKAMAFIFNEKGNLIGKSNLLFDESDDIITSCANLKQTKIDYNVISVSKINSTCTRKEKMVIESLLEYLEKIHERKKDYEIKYMYFECFDKVSKDDENAYLELIKQIKNANFSVVEKLQSLIKVLKK